MNMQKYDSFYNDIISHWEILSQLKQNGIPDTDNSLETSFNLSQSYQNDFWDKINKLNNRFVNIQNYFLVLFNIISL